MRTVKTFTIYNIYRTFDGTPELHSVEVTDSGGKFLRAKVDNSGLAFGCRRLIERNKFPRSALEAWKAYVKQCHERIKSHDRFKKLEQDNIKYGEGEIFKLVFSQGKKGK